MKLKETYYHTPLSVEDTKNLTKELDKKTFSELLNESVSFFGEFASENVNNWSNEKAHQKLKHFINTFKYFRELIQDLDNQLYQADIEENTVLALLRQELSNRLDHLDS